MRLSSQRRPRSGFTMLELMIVIVIIVLLASLLLAAVNKVIVRVEEVRAIHEVGQFAQALEQFKLSYGRYPPSYIVLREAAGAYSANTDYANLNQLTTLFANFDETVAHDWNADGDVTDTITLQGQECLVYFLLGPGQNPNGFATNKANPVAISLAAPQRIGPFFEANMARLQGIDRLGMNNWDATRGVYRGYLDPYGTQYAYFLGMDTATNNYRGYLCVFNQPNDCSSICGATFMPYWQSCTPAIPILPTAGNPTPNLITFHRRDKFQLLCAGRDRLFGVGGGFNQNDPQASYWNPTNATQTIQADQGRPGVLTMPDRVQDDYDNITNFTEGKLVE
jgi:general secretion pathway protein G